MAYLGNRTTGAVGSNNVQECIGTTGDQFANVTTSPAHKASENGHAYKLGIRAGAESGTTCKPILVAYKKITTMSTAELMGQTAMLTVTTDWDTSQPLLTSDLLEAFLIYANSDYAPGVHETNGYLEIGLNGVNPGSSGNPVRGIGGWVSDTPPDPFGSNTTFLRNGFLYAWIEYEPNVAPDIPSDFSPADGATVTDTTPTYEADFTDDNQSLPGGVTSLEKLLNYQIQVRSVTAENDTSGTVVWDSGTVPASGTEQTNSRFSKEHGGSALSLGTRYQWRCRVQDVFGTWSSWSHADAAAWSDFFVASGGVVTLEDDPTGRITDTTPDFEGKYHHVSGTAADRVQVRLYANDTLILTSPEITKAVSSAALPGTLFTITAAESTFGTLASGVNYGYSIRARTTGTGVWSDYSAIRSFNTNARPTTPTNLRIDGQPSGGVVSDYPVLTCQTSDADGDSLTVTAYLTEDDGTPIDDLAMTYDATLYSGTGGYKTAQLTGTELSTFDTYKFTCDADDGDLSSTASAEASFVFAEGPTVTITSPTADEVITTDTPTFTWTVTDQQKERIRVYRASDDVLVHDSTQLVDTGNSYAMPPDILANETDYYVTVQIEDSNPLTGTSAARAFRLEYTPPDSVTGFFAAPDFATFDVVESVIRLTWDPVTTDAAQFEGYVIKARDVGLPYSAATVKVTFLNKEQSTWVDTNVVSGVEQVYSIEQKVRESSMDVLTSVPVESPATVNLNGSVISDARDGLQLRVVFDSVQERTENVVRNVTEIPTWDGGAPWSFEGPGYYRPIEMEAQLYQTGSATPDDVLAALRGEPHEAYPLVAPYGGMSGVRADGSNVLACYRDERGRKVFGRVRDVQVSDQRLRRANVSFTFQPVNYSEEVS